MKDNTQISTIKELIGTFADNCINYGKDSNKAVASHVCLMQVIKELLKEQHVHS